MFKVLIINSLCFVGLLGYSQNITISRQVIGSYGSSHNLGNMVIMDNVGEVAIQTLSSSNLKLTQGFEQPKYTISPVILPFEPPNAFSPDGDGTNENWILPLNSDISKNRVLIFNRWGDVINSFENYNNIDVVWNGTNLDGKLVVEGTYFYVVEFLLSGFSKSGWIQVVR